MSLRQLDSLVGQSQGSADLTFAVRGGRTRLVKSHVIPPLVVQRTLYLDENLDDMAFVYLANPTAGIFQGDRQIIEIKVSPGAKAHVTNQSATKIHAMPELSASQDTRLIVEDQGYLEYLPEPIIPFQGARFSQRAHISVATNGTLIYAEIIASGRLAHGELLAYHRLRNSLTVSRPDGYPIYHEAYCLQPEVRFPLASGILMNERQSTLGTMLIVTNDVEAAVLADNLRECLNDSFATSWNNKVGITSLSGGYGVGIKVTGSEPQSVKLVLTHLWSASRRQLLGSEAPAPRKY